MVIVTGRVRVRDGCLDEAVALSLEHVRRSRSEPGCLLHSVHRDVEDPASLVFLERWQDLAALRTHFAVPASGAFVTALAALADGRPEMAAYEARPAEV